MYVYVLSVRAVSVYKSTLYIHSSVKAAGCQEVFFFVTTQENPTTFAALNVSRSKAVKIHEHRSTTNHDISCLILFTHKHSRSHAHLFETYSE